MIEFLQTNWFWILLVVLFVGMHAFGGGCGMGYHRQQKRNPGEENKEGQGRSCH